MTATALARQTGSWQQEVYALLRKNGVTQFAYVPDGGHKALIDMALADNAAHAVSLTTEAEGIGVLAGADLGGTRGVMLIQSSGVGNCINQLSLTSLGRFPLLMLVTMRGDFGEANPWQFPMGQASERVLNAMGVATVRIDDPDKVVTMVEYAIAQAFKGQQPTAVLLTQLLLGPKAFE